MHKHTLALLSDGVLGSMCCCYAARAVVEYEPQIVVDIFRVEGGKLVEHWDVLQNEVPVAAGVHGLSMFDPEEGTNRA